MKYSGINIQKINIYNISILLLLLVIAINADAQIQNKRGNMWYFGSAALDFNNVMLPSDLPVLITNSNMLSSSESSTCISDKNGEILFYTNGERVWDKTHNTMQNGNNLDGNTSAYESAIIGPVIGDPNKYYIFTVDAAENFFSNGLRYSVVDMCLNNGKGAIVSTKKNQIAGPARGERITAIKHANNIDYWIVVPFSGGFNSYLININGVSTSPVFSNITISLGNSVGQLNASADGKSIIYGSTIVTLLDFNNQTGLVSNPVILETMSIAIGVSAIFSPNDSLVYGYGNVYKRFDADPASTRRNVSGGNGQWAIGADDKIYISGTGSVKVIENPNDYDNAAITATIPLTPRNGGTTSHLPKIFTHFATVQNDPYKFNYLKEDTAICTGDSVQIQIGADSVPGLLYSWLPAVSLDNNQIANPIATVKATTTYTVMVIANCDTLYDSITITIDSLPNAIASPSVSSFCTGDSIQLGATGGVTYNWTPAIGLSNPSVQNPFAKPNDTTIYIVTVTDINGCSGKDSLVIYVNPNPTMLISGDTTICLGDSAGLLATGGISYRWNPSTSLNNDMIPNPKAAPTSTTTYYVRVTNSSNCEAIDSTTVYIIPSVVAVAGPTDTTICKGNTVLLWSNGGSDYSWFPTNQFINQDSPEQMISPSITTTYTVVVSDQCTSDSTLVLINVSNCFVFIPNAFSPNGDGENDIFKIRGDDIDNIVINVFDRWGNVIFETTDINQSWDGKNSKGADVLSGVYVYSLTAKFIDGKEIVRKGNISLIR